MSGPGRWERARGMALGLLLVPGFYFTEHALPGFPEAEGCSAQGSGPTGQWIEREPGESSVAVATDGFFVFNAPADVVVTVTTPSGDLVDGTIENYEGVTGWQATELLAPGSRLSAVVATAEPPVTTDEVELRVVGEPTPVVATGLAFGDWLGYAQPVGELVECTPPSDPGDSCNDGAVYAPAAIDLVDVVELSWSPPAGADTYVVWELKISTEDFENANQSRSDQFTIRRLQEIDWGWFKFPPSAERYCVTLSARDVRTGETASHETCTEPEPTTTVLRDYDLSRCEELPSEAMSEEWCEAHPESTLAACTGEQEPSPNEPSAGPDESNARRTSKGCSASGGSPTSGGLLLLASLAAVALRRRRAPAAPRA